MEHQELHIRTLQPRKSNSVPVAIYIVYDLLMPPGLEEPNYLELRYRKIDHVFQMEEFMGFPELVI